MQLNQFICSCVFMFTLESNIISIGVCQNVGGSEDVVDTSYPILISASEGNSNISPSFFGYSVALAQGKSGQGKSSYDPDGWIFIGAPKSNATSDMYQSNKNLAMEPGVIWRCSLGRKSSLGLVDSCEMVNIDPASTNTRPGAPRYESHNGAWVGASLEVNHDRLLTCGMRWNRGSFNFYNGICYWFNDTAGSNRSFISNDLSLLVNKRTYDQRLTTFFTVGKTPNDYPERAFSFINSANVNASGNEWRLSQEGVAVHLFKDDTLGPDSPANLLIGAPGVREWSGAVVLYTNANFPRKELERRNRDKKDPTFSEFVVGNRGFIPEPRTKRPRYHWNDYFGYSVTSGKYFEQDKLHYAAGAPRAQYTGEVVIFDFPPYDPPSSTFKRQIRPVLEIQAPKDAFASYFGAVVYTVDVDGDGIDELVVGAPTYSLNLVSSPETVRVGKSAKISTTPEPLTKSEEAGDHGGVFIYNFNKTDITSSTSVVPTPEILDGSRTPLARFGSSITSFVFNLKNGTRQVYLVVGAPFEPLQDSNDTSGAIYFYPYLHASKKFGRFSQRIVASKTQAGFGSSLSLPVDIDLNDTPDLAIGSFKSGDVVVLRTRTKIELKSWIKFISYERKEIEEVRRGSPQFYLQSCFSVNENLGLVTLDVDIWVRVRLFDKTIKFSSSDVRRSPVNSETEIIYKSRVRTHTESSCRNLTVSSRYKDGIGMDDSDFISEIPLPFQFVQDVWYNETMNRPLTPFQFYALVDANDRSPGKLENIGNFLSFESKKPSPQQTRSTSHLDVSLNDCRGTVCYPEIAVEWSFSNEKGEEVLNDFVLGSFKELHVKILISNTGESAIQPSITIDWNLKCVKESSLGTQWIQRTCDDHSDTLIRNYGCPLGQYIKTGRNVTVDFQLNVDEIYVRNQENIRLVMNGAVSFQDRHNDPVRSQQVLVLSVPQTNVEIRGSRRNGTLLRPAKYYVTEMTGHLRGESGKGWRSDMELANTTEMVLYSYFEQEFSIHVAGASVRRLHTQFKLPVFTNDGSTKLFLVKQPSNGNCKVELAEQTFYEINSTSPTTVETDGEHDSHVSPTFVSTVEWDVEVSPERFQNDVNVTFASTTDNPATDGTIAFETKSPSRPAKDKKIESPQEATITLFCGDSSGSCLEVACTIDNIKANSHVHITFQIYPIKTAIDTLLNPEEEKTSILVEAAGYAKIFNGESRYLHEDSDVGQTLLVKLFSKPVATWVYVVSSIVGVLVLLLIIFGLYKCGFFKREKLEQLNHMKAEHHRKSMIHAARTSIMQSSSSGVADDSQSQDILTEIEEDTEEETTEPKPMGEQLENYKEKEDK